MVSMMTARCIAAVVRRIFDLIFTIDIDTDDLIGVCVAHVAIVGVDNRRIVAWKLFDKIIIVDINTDGLIVPICTHRCCYRRREIFVPTFGSPVGMRCVRVMSLDHQCRYRQWWPYGYRSSACVAIVGERSVFQLLVLLLAFAAWGLSRQIINVDIDTDDLVNFPLRFLCRSSASTWNLVLRYVRISSLAWTTVGQMLISSVVGVVAGIDERRIFAVKPLLTNCCVRWWLVLRGSGSPKQFFHRFYVVFHCCGWLENRIANQSKCMLLPAKIQLPVATCIWSGSKFFCRFFCRCTIHTQLFCTSSSNDDDDDDIEARR